MEPSPQWLEAIEEVHPDFLESLRAMGQMRFDSDD